MRHLLGFVLGVVLTPLLAAGAAWGFGHSSRTAARLVADPAAAAPGLAVMALVGVVVALLIATRVSPLAALLPGLALLAWTAAHAAAWRDAVPRQLLRTQVGPDAVALLSGGVYCLLGAALLVSALRPQRWRRARREGPRAATGRDWARPDPDEEFLPGDDELYGQPVEPIRPASMQYPPPGRYPPAPMAPYPQGGAGRYPPPARPPGPPPRA
ncbi:MAG TPA: hypothetical protein VKG45_12340 [Actinomycetes bacterium]|nr:hypothetical protein [Actinomycetes bacterium]